MVIHDLKHPTESMISQLLNMETELQNQIGSIRRLENVYRELYSNFDSFDNSQQ